MSEYIKHVIEIEKVKKEADELMMKKIDHYEKEIALVREDAQIQILTFLFHRLRSIKVKSYLNLMISQIHIIILIASQN